MKETIEKIVARVSFEKKEKLQKMLYKCMYVSDDTQKRTTASYDNVLLKMDVFFDSLSKSLNDVPKINKFKYGIETLAILYEELGLDVEPEDAFIVYHIKDLGKFKIRDSKLKEQLKSAWSEHKEYILTDQEFSRSLKVLMRHGIIDYRKGNLSLKKEVLIRYRD